ncbi:MAG: tetratricopeptide repeat protein [Planctomycetales bacterium]
MKHRKLLSAVAFAAAMVFAFAPPVAIAQAEKEAADAAARRDYAVALTNQQLKLYPEAAKRWTQFIQDHPQDERIPNAQYHLGVCQYQQKQLSEAAATFTQLLAKHPQFEHRDGVQFNLGLVQYGVASESRKPEDYQQAAQTFALVPQQHPKSDQADAAIYYQAECLYAAGDKAAALPVYRNLLTAYPHSRLLADATYALGTAEQEVAKFDEAAQTFAAFLKQFPQAEQANECRLRLGMVQLARKQFAEAEKLFAELAAVPDFAFADYALLQQALSRLEQSKPEDAAALYESLPKKFPKSSYAGTALLEAGKCRFRGEKYEPARADLEQVVALKSPDTAPEAAYWLGRSLLRLARAAEAEQVLAQTIAAYPQSDRLPQLQLARIDAVAEQPERLKEAAGQYAEFAAKHAADPLAADALYRASRAAFETADYAAARKHAETFLGESRFAEHLLHPQVLFVGAESSLVAEPPDFAKAQALFQQLVDRHPDDGQAALSRVRIGYCLYSAKKFDDAVAQLAKAVPLLKQPELVAEAHLLAGRSHLDAGRHEPATQALRAAWQANPKWERGDEVLLLLAGGLRRQDQLDQAAVELVRLNDQFPKSALRGQAFFQLGEIAFAGKKYDDAVANYRNVVTEIPKDPLAPRALYGSGTALFAKGDYDAAAAELTKLLNEHAEAEIASQARYLRGVSHQQAKKYEPAAADFTQFLQGKPGDEDAREARFALGLCQAGLGKHQDAIKTWGDLLAASPKYERADQVLYEIGHAWSALEKPNEATAAFRRLATEHPESGSAAEAWFRVGDHHERQKEWDKAAEAFTAGAKLAKKPELQERLRYKLAWTQFNQDAFAEAAKTLAAQLEAHPQGELAVDGEFLLAESLYRQSEFAKALPHFQKVIAANAAKDLAYALYRGGDCAAAEKKWPDSRQYYSTLLQKFPEFEKKHEARYGVGFALQNESKFDEAKQVYEQIAKGDTETAAKARFMIGECAFAQKKHAEAVQHFLEVAVGYPYKEWQALAHYEAGRCFIELKQPEQARVELRIVIDKHPEHPRAKDAAQLIANLDKQP